MNLPTLKTVEVNNKTVLLRVDFNVPINKNGAIEDDTRIQSTLSTIQYLTKNNAKVVIISHMGRPKGKVIDSLRLDNVGKRLSELLSTPVQKLNACVGEEVTHAVHAMKPGNIVLLENIRFYEQEENNEPQFGAELAKLGDIYVNDAFACSHRSHASIVGIAQYIPGYIGFLVETEVRALSHGIAGDKHPVTVVLGGAKVDTKIGIIKHFIHKADAILFGGAIANTFLVASGFNVGKSLYEEEKIQLAQEIMLEAEKTNCKIHLPIDSIVASELIKNCETLDIPIEDIEGDMKIFDIGQKTAQNYAHIIQNSELVIWNGPVGVHEYENFSHGSTTLANAMKNTQATTLLGGGDTIDFLEKYGFPFENFTHVSTAGGAMVEFLEGKPLPGLTVLQK